jgi:hypothetical protein
MSSIQPITISERETYNALIGLSGTPMSQSAYALLKVAYRITPDGLKRITPEPFAHSIHEEKKFGLLKTGTDFYPFKQATDVVVQGSAFCLSSATSSSVTVNVGKMTKRIWVFGNRRILYRNGRVVIDSPEPFCEMPLVYENAYGGVDMRIEMPNDERSAFLTGCDHPGLYPRNPFGKGYLARRGEIPESAEMPNLEDPYNLLTEERLIVSDPRYWYLQPMPACFDWLHLMCFPRYVFMGTDAWFEGPEDERMPEVKLGYLPNNYRTNAGDSFGPTLNFFQEASLGMTMTDIRPGDPVAILGMHPERKKMVFNIPKPPSLSINLEGDEQAAPLRMHHMVARPKEELVYFVYGAHRPLHRTLIPGIHKEIPISISVDGDLPIRFEAPRTMKSRLEEAMQGQ